MAKRTRTAKTKLVPPAGRPKRTPAKQPAPVTGGKLKGSMRTRAGADEGYRPKGTNLDAPKPRKRNPRGNRA